MAPSSTQDREAAATKPAASEPVSRLPIYEAGLGQFVNRNHRTPVESVVQVLEFLTQLLHTGAEEILLARWLK